MCKQAKCPRSGYVRCIRRPTCCRTWRCGNHPTPLSRRETTATCTPGLNTPALSGRNSTKSTMSTGVTGREHRQPCSSDSTLVAGCLPSPCVCNGASAWCCTLHPATSCAPPVPRAGIAVADSTLFWQVVRSEAEAGYLVALLNARCLRRAFAESKESGRHFQLHPWRKVPIPRYDRTNASHRRLGVLCSRAEAIVERRVKEELVKHPDLQQQKLSDIARHAVLASAAGREIEDLARQLLPAQAD